MHRVSTRLFLASAVFVAIVSAFLLYRSHSASSRYINELARRQARMALAFDLAIRNYVGEKIRPLVYQLAGRDVFLPEAMSTSYVARSIFDEVQKEFPDIILKFSSDAPRNPANLAGPEEHELLERFRSEPELEGWEGRIRIGDEVYMGIFRPRRMQRECLHCHGDPADAPPALVELYGDRTGFHRRPGEVVAMDTVAIPLSRLQTALRSEMAGNFMATVSALLVMLAVFLLISKRLLTDRLAAMARHFENPAGPADLQELDPVLLEGNDEISSLARAFNGLVRRARATYRNLENEIEKRNRTNRLLLTEIRERRAAEEAMDAAWTQYREIFDNAVFGIFQCGRDGRLLRANRAMARILGLDDPAALTGPEPAFSLPFCSDPEERARFFSSTNGHVVAQHDFFVETPRGHRRLRVTARRTRDREGNDLVEGFVEDTTEAYEKEQERKRLETELQHAQRMESIGRLAGGVAHDFNNLLSSILGYAELLQTQLPEESPLRPHVRMIMNAGEQAAALTRQLLAFSRKQPIEKRSLDINGTVLDTARLLRRTIGENIRVETDLRARAATVKADPTKLGQVLMNLAVNARDAMPDGGVLRFETENLEAREPEVWHDESLPPGRYIVLSVSDTGIGIPPGEIPKIFEPFFTTKQTGKGTGLGLATVYGIVKQHGGYLTVESTPGRGSRFRIALPALEDGREEAPAAFPGALRRGDETLLVVDDEASIRSLIVQTFRPLGYRVLEAASGEEALRIAEAEKEAIDLILTDVVMPGMNGPELADAVKPHCPGAPVIFMSGYSANVIRDAGDSWYAGRPFLHKPVTPSVLSEKVREVLDHRKGD